MKEKEIKKRIKKMKFADILTYRCLKLQCMNIIMLIIIISHMSEILIRTLYILWEINFFPY